MWAFEFIRRVLSYKGNAILAQLHDPERHPSQDAAVAQFAKHCHIYSVGYDKAQFATATVKALTAKLAGDGVDLDEDDLSGFFCSEFTAEAIKRAALNHDHAVRRCGGEDARPQRGGHDGLHEQRCGERECAQQLAHDSARDLKPS